MLIVVGYLLISADNREAHLALSRPAVELARDAPGCLHFAVSADGLEPNRVNIAEVWANRAQLDAFRSRSDGSDDVDPFIYIKEFHVEEFEVAPATEN